MIAKLIAKVDYSYSKDGVKGTRRKGTDQTVELEGKNKKLNRTS